MQMSFTARFTVIANSILQQFFLTLEKARNNRENDLIKNKIKNKLIIGLPQNKV